MRLDVRRTLLNVAARVESTDLDLALRIADAADNSNATAAVVSVVAKYPELASWLQDVKAGKPSSGGDPEARAFNGGVTLFPKFFALPEATRDFVLAHEVGHLLLAEYPKGLNGFVSLAETLGVNVWDTDTLPYGQYQMEEAFAESYANYVIEPEHTKRKYPKWFEIVDTIVAATPTP